MMSDQKTKAYMRAWVPKQPSLCMCGIWNVNLPSAIFQTKHEYGWLQFCWVNHLADQPFVKCEILKHWRWELSLQWWLLLSTSNVLCPSRGLVLKISLYYVRMYTCYIQKLPQSPTGNQSSKHPTNTIHNTGSATPSKSQMLFPPLRGCGKIFTGEAQFFNLMYSTRWEVIQIKNHGWTFSFKHSLHYHNNNTILKHCHHQPSQ
jgi:hypothetical protein